jgi:hypothetical protein
VGDEVKAGSLAESEGWIFDGLEEDFRVAAMRRSWLQRALSMVYSTVGSG